MSVSQEESPPLQGGEDVNSGIAGKACSLEQTNSQDHYDQLYLKLYREFDLNCSACMKHVMGNEHDPLGPSSSSEMTLS
jgi:hypothetical protein